MTKFFKYSDFLYIIKINGKLQRRIPTPPLENGNLWALEPLDRRRK